jgi:CheY-like chemotaxis protein/GGDEF domain-containing protein
MAEARSSILIVDDDTEDLSSVQKTLVSLGAEIEAIKDPHEVLATVRRLRPDVVILDALLPGLSGFDLCKQIKTDADLKTTQVIILTGVYLRQQYRNEALNQFKADGYLTKPFRPPELQRLVVQLLARKTKTPPSSLLKKIGLPPAPESKRKGLLGRLFGRGEDEETAAVRISPASRGTPKTRPAEEIPAERVQAEPTAEIALEPPAVEAQPEAVGAPEPPPARAVSPSLTAAEVQASLPPSEPPQEEASFAAPPTGPEIAPPPEPERAQPQEADREVEPEPGMAEPHPSPAPETAPVEDPQTVLVAPSQAPAPDVPGTEPSSEVTPDPETVLAAPVAEPESPGTIAVIPAPVRSEPSAVVASEPPPEGAGQSAPPREGGEEEPAPSTILDVQHEPDPEEVTWIETESKTREMTLEEAAARVEEGSRSAQPAEPEAPPPPAAEPDLSPAPSEEVGSPRETAKRPRLRLGDVPIYDEPDFLAELRRELSKCKRVDRPLTLILIRVGDLGQIVELFGKDFRERVLWHIAEQAMESLREVDLVGMMSSTDRIAMTAFASDRYGGGRIVSRMRQAATKNPFRVGVELPPIIPVLDFGMATFPADGSEVEGLLHRAEEDLVAGRDRTVVPD